VRFKGQHRARESFGRGPGPLIPDRFQVRGGTTGPGVSADPARQPAQRLPRPARAIFAAYRRSLAHLEAGDLVAGVFQFAHRRQDRRANANTLAGLPHSHVQARLNRNPPACRFRPAIPRARAADYGRALGHSESRGRNRPQRSDQHPHLVQVVRLLITNLADTVNGPINLQQTPAGSQAVVLTGQAVVGRGICQLGADVIRSTHRHRLKGLSSAVRW